MNRRTFVTSLTTVISIGMAGCLSSGNEDGTPSVPSEEDLQEKARENATDSATAEGDIEIVSHEGTSSGDGRIATVTLENTGDDPTKVEVDIVGYDGNGDLFFVKTDEIGSLESGETIAREYTINPEDFADIDEVIAYDIQALTF